MLRMVFRELLILLLSLAVVPVVVLGFIAVTGSSTAAATLLARVPMRIVGDATGGLLPSLLLPLLSPYLLVQCVRAFLWSQRSISGRRWAHLYFTLLLVFTGISAFRESWDLFMFMYALGDIPAELPQFLELEALNLLGLLGSIVLGTYCFRIFLDPARTPFRRSDDEHR